MPLFALCRALLAALLLAGCAALPRSAPLSLDIEAAEQDDGASRRVIAPLTPQTAEIASPARQPDIPAAFLRAGEIDQELIGVGDELALRIWEPVEQPLFRTQSGAEALRLKVDRSGRAHLPFAGKIHAAGLSLEALRQRAADALAPYLADPEVDLRLLATPSRMVTIQGSVNKPGAYAIQSFAARLGPMLALAGGAAAAPETLELTLRRGDRTARGPLATFLEQPELNLALRPGDAVMLAPTRQRFTAIGAVTSQATIAFPYPRLSLLDALGLVRGLRDFDADPRAVYLFRREDPALAARLLDGDPPSELEAGGGRAIIYHLDLTQPESVFAAQRFAMRDGDALVAANAPLTELRKIVSLFGSIVSPVDTTIGLVE